MRYKFIKIALCLLLAFLACGAVAGSADDPLVTRSWVDQYIASQVAPLQTRVEQASQQLGSVRSIKLWIGRDYLQTGEKQVKLDAAPYLGSSGRTMVPLRALGDSIGAELNWDGSAKRVVYTKDDKEVVLWLGRAEVQVNGQRVPTDCAPELRNDRVMVPLRVVTENLGFTLSWNNGEKMAALLYIVSPTDKTD